MNQKIERFLVRKMTGGFLSGQKTDFVDPLAFFSTSARNDPPVRKSPSSPSTTEPNRALRRYVW